MRILTVEEIRAVERAAVAAGGSYDALMEQAGKRAADRIAFWAAEKQLGRCITFLCGRGNNAGDAFVAAHYLAREGWQVAISLLCGDNFSRLAAENLRRLPPEILVGKGLSPQDLHAPLLCDGVFGIGFHGTLPAPVVGAFRGANNRPALRIALDLPSGLDADSGAADPDTFQADLTLTFGALKPALAAKRVQPVYGLVECLDIGL